MIRITILACLACCFNAFGAAFTSTTSGPFSAGATWVGGVAPSADGDTWTIASGTTVLYDADNSAQPNGWGASVVTGTLWMTNACYLKMNGNLSGAGVWNIGTNNAVIGWRANRVPGVIVDWRSGGCTMTASGALNWFGDTTSFYDFTISNTFLLATGDYTNLYFTNNVSGVASNDVVFIQDNTIAGQGGEFAIVFGVTTNKITLFNVIPTAESIITNYWPGIAFQNGITTHARTNGALVIRMSRAIQCFNNSGTLTLVSSSSADTFNGVSIVHFSVPIKNSVSGKSTFSNCAGSGNSSGGIASGCPGATITSCVGSGNSNGGIANGCAGATITSCVGSGNSNGGIASGSPGATITSCVGSGNSNGGIANSCSGATITSCVGSGNSNGGIANGCSGATINCIATNQSAPILEFNPYGTTVWDNQGYSISSAITFAAKTDFDVLLWNGTNWQSNGGAVILTNVTQTFSSWIYAHYPKSSSNTVPYFVDVSIKPLSGRNVEMWTQGDTGLGWFYQVTPPTAFPLTPTNLTYSTTGWTLNSIALTNNTTDESISRLWLYCIETNAANTELSWINVPTDYSVYFK